MDLEEKSSSDSQEEAPLDPPDQSIEHLTGFSSILSLQEYEEAIDPKREPQLYLCERLDQACGSNAKAW